MRVYNAEFFHTDYSFICNRNFSELEYSFDYVAPDTSSFIVERMDGVVSGDWVQITGGERAIYGIVDHVDNTEGLSEVFIKQMTALFDVPILFDTDLQPSVGGTKTLEVMIGDFVKEMYANNPDANQNIQGLTVTETSSTQKWGFNLTSTYAGMHHLIINFWKSILSRALTKYRVTIEVTPDFAAKTMNVTIGVNASPVKTIEADLPNVIEKSIIVGQKETSYNKAVVYNGQNYAQSITYYLHSDGTFDTNNTDRVMPVIFDVADVDMSDATQSFEDGAESAAREILGGTEINNNITLTTMNDDELVGVPQIGQMVNIISEGMQYTSMMTGYSIGETTTVVFGTVRTELTKRIQGER